MIGKVRARRPPQFASASAARSGDTHLVFSTITATAEEVAAPRPGDDLVPDADVVMDRAFSVEAPPADVWPWVLQLGKHRAGWYLPRTVERTLPRRRRAARSLDDRWLHLEVGDVIPDYGGRNETFEVAIIDAPSTLVYRSRRGRVDVSWSITLADAAPGLTRVRLRLRLDPVRRKWLANSAGDLVDALTIAGMAAGLRERLRPR